MSDHARLPASIRLAIAQLFATGRNAPSPEDKKELLSLVRDHSKEASNQLDGLFLQRHMGLGKDLQEATKGLKEAKELLETLTAPPLFPAIIVEAGTGGEDGAEALVNSGGTLSVVGVHSDVDLSELARGEAVLLGSEKNVIVRLSRFSPFETGHTAVFDRYLGEDRAVIRFRGEEAVVHLAGRLRDDPIRSGELVLWNQELRIALERLERSDGSGLFIEETPPETLDDIGGLDLQIRQVTEEIGLRLEHPRIVRKYQLRPASSILLVGPPGGGKTLLARGVANWLASVSRTGRSRFMNIKPGGLASMWYGQTEENIREAFRVAREAGEEEPDVPIVIFFDEVDTLTSARGHSFTGVDDRVTAALLAELNGFESRGNVLVISATNRRDSLDAAAMRQGRLGDLVLEIPRPGPEAARAILGKHLLRDLPFGESPSGAKGADARQEILEAVISRVYAPNGLGELARLTFRDGKTRGVEGRHLMSGALLANLARIATVSAGLREARTGEEGIRQDDLLEALEAELEQALKTLTPANCHRFLDDLPQDVDVVRIEVEQRRVRMETRYLSVA